MKKTKKKYQKPSLKIFGKIEKITLSGAGSGMEGMSTMAKKSMM